MAFILRGPFFDFQIEKPLKTGRFKRFLEKNKIYLDFTTISPQFPPNYSPAYAFPHPKKHCDVP
jgi:hypothetical protein